MATSKELREQNEEQLGLTIKEVSKKLFDLRCKAATEKVNPNEKRYLRREIARIKTIQRERELKNA